MKVHHGTDVTLDIVAQTHLSDGTPLIRLAKGIVVSVHSTESSEENHSIDGVVFAVSRDLAKRLADDLLAAVRQLDSMA